MVWKESLTIGVSWSNQNMFLKQNSWSKYFETHQYKLAGLAKFEYTDSAKQ